MKKLIALILLLLAGNSYADKLQVIPLRLIVIDRPDISANKQIELFVEGVSRFNEVGAYINIVDVKVIPDYLNFNTYEAYQARLYRWHDWAIANKVTTNRIMTHYLLPPVILNNQRYMGGVAGGICTNELRNKKRRFSYSIMIDKNRAGQDRSEHSRTVAFHELAHNLGASHYDKVPNFMHSAAMNFLGTYQSYLLHPITKKDVKGCRTRGRVRW